MLKIILVLALAPLMAFSYAKPCDFSKKGIKTDYPQAPIGLSKDYQFSYKQVFEVLCKNLKTPNRFFKGYRAHPGPPYKAAYLWDTAFISQVWMYWDVNIAKELINYIMRFQKKDGMVKHAVLEILIKPYAYSNSQPPLLSWASWRIYEVSQDVDYIRNLYPKLVKYQDWLRRNRKNQDGLYFWKHPYESGIDNSPRFSNRDESKFEDTTKMAAVDMSSYIALSLESLEKMALVLELSDEARAYRAEYESLKVKINERLWDPIDKTYYDWDYRKNSFVKMNTISNFTPLIAGIPSPLQAEFLVIRLMDKKQYNTKIPFPSVARDDDTFLKDMWRGPVWINMAYLSILGLKRAGYHREASEMAKKIVFGIYETFLNEGSFYEFYDPDRYDIEELDRKKGNWWKKLTLGSKPVKNFVGWTGLANSLVFEFGRDWFYSIDKGYKKSRETSVRANSPEHSL